jgi:Helix-turn-helix domain
MLVIEDRLSDSPLVERVWTARSERAGRFLSVASEHSEIVVSRLRGQTFFTIRGPETKVTTADYPADGRWVGIRFKAGAFLPEFAPAIVRDRNDVNLPGATKRSFWLAGSAWEYPTFENADTFVARLVRKGILVCDRTVDAIVRGEQPPLSPRSAQRHFARATGLTHATYRKIKRARVAANLLLEGVPILDVVHLAGYCDQPHLTRSLKILVGLTPAEIARGKAQLSYLYKTELSP